MKINFVLIVFISLTSVSIAQSENELFVFETQRQKINQTAMLVLGSWAVGNIFSELMEISKLKMKQNISISLMQCGTL
jgi:hypothetical protein